MRFNYCLPILGFFWFLGIGNANAQNPWCGTTRSLTDSVDYVNLQAFEAFYQNRLNQSSRSQKKDAKYIIPVVFHVIHEGGNENVSAAALEGLLEQVNQDFSLTNKDTTRIRPVFREFAAKCDIEFRLAQIDPTGKCTNGITRTFSGLTNEVRDYGGNNVKTLVKWNNKKYLNIWIVKSIYSNGNEGTVTLGYSYYPGGFSQNDGIVLRYDQMNGNSLTHEIGHYLNLAHTFEDGCYGGDKVADTPPAAQANFGCPKDRNSCSNDGSIDYLDQIENYMDYSSCSAMFTLGQKSRMQSAIDFYRAELVSEANLSATGVGGNVAISSPIASFEVMRRIACTGENISMNNTSCNHDANATFLWLITGKQQLTSTEENPTFVFDSTGLYSVKLTVTNSKGNNTVVLNNALSIKNSGGELMSPFSTSFNTDYDLPKNWQYEHTDNSMRWVLNPNGVDQSACLFINNFADGKSSNKSAFILPSIDISASDDPFLRYDLAYAKIDNLSTDIFQISVSIDCGKSWRLISTEVSSSLATTTDRSNAFVPKDKSDWVEIETDLSRYMNFKNLLIKVEFISGGGNNIYFDNLRIGTDKVGFDDYVSPMAFRLYPNPSKAANMFTIEGPSYENMVLITLFDLTGRICYETKTAGNKTIISTESLNKGIYLAVIHTNKGKVVKRLIIN